MIATDCLACWHYEVQEGHDDDSHISPKVPCCSHHRYSGRPAAGNVCQGYVPWLRVAQEVIARDLRTMHEKLDDPRGGCRGFLGSLNRRGHDLMASVQKLEDLLEQTEEIPLTTPKPRQLMGIKAPAAFVYVNALRDVLRHSERGWTRLPRHALSMSCHR